MWLETRDNSAVRLALKANLPFLWSTETGDFIMVSMRSAKDHSNSGTGRSFGRFIVWTGEGKPEVLRIETRITNADLDARYGKAWREVK